MATFLGEITLYEHIATAIINDDYSDLSEDEITELKEFLEVELPAYFNATSARIYNALDDAYFGKPELCGKLAGTVCTCEVSYTV